jgi:hypothetical protein
MQTSGGPNMSPEFIQFLENLLLAYVEQQRESRPYMALFWDGKVSATKIILKHAIREQAEQRIKAIR